jgi:hypothetical protein
VLNASRSLSGTLDSVLVGCRQLDGARRHRCCPRRLLSAPYTAFITSSKRPECRRKKSVNACMWQLRPNESRSSSMVLIPRSSRGLPLAQAYSRRSGAAWNSIPRGRI